MLRRILGEVGPCPLRCAQLFFELTFLKLIVHVHIDHPDTRVVDFTGDTDRRNRGQLATRHAEFRAARRLQQDFDLRLDRGPLCRSCFRLYEIIVAREYFGRSSVSRNAVWQIVNDHISPISLALQPRSMIELRGQPTIARRLLNICGLDLNLQIVYKVISQSLVHGHLIFGQITTASIIRRILYRHVFHHLRAFSCG